VTLARRFFYFAGLASVAAAFLAEILQGGCPVP
jgi:hypothetical protein